MVIVCDTQVYPDNDDDDVGETLTLREAFARFPFALSPFQKHSIQGIVEGHHVLVTAHTLCSIYIYMLQRSVTSWNIRMRAPSVLLLVFLVLLRGSTSALENPLLRAELPKQRGSLRRILNGQLGNTSSAAAMRRDLMGNPIYYVAPDVMQGAQIGEDYGWIVVMNGNTMLVGGDVYNNYVGRVTVSTCSGTQCTLRSTIYNPNPSTQGLFGQGLASALMFAVVGAPVYLNRGIAYVYQISDVSNPSLVLTLQPPATSSRFGTCVTMFEDSNGQGVVVVVGDGQGTALYVYSFPSTSSTSYTLTTLAAPEGGSSFGYPLQQSHGWFATSSQSLQRVYVFSCASSGSCAQQGNSMMSPSGVANTYFGYMLAIQLETASNPRASLVAGSCYGNGQNGVAYVYQWTSSSTWSLTATLLPQPSTTLSYFGAGVAMSAGTLAVASVNQDGHGALYVYYINNGAVSDLIQIIDCVAPSCSLSNFGNNAIALSGTATFLAVGARYAFGGYSFNAYGGLIRSGTGAVYIFSTAPTAQPTPSPTTPSANPTLSPTTCTPSTSTRNDQPCSQFAGQYNIPARATMGTIMYSITTNCPVGSASTFTYISGCSFPPTPQPTPFPVANPTLSPTFLPSARPSFIPSPFPIAQPTTPPSAVPSPLPSFKPSALPTQLPSFSPSAQPTFSPSAQPTPQPTLVPSAWPTKQPSSLPTADPTMKTDVPTPFPTPSPTAPSANPTARPTNAPSSLPTFDPSAVPSAKPSFSPSAQPTSEPTSQPTVKPSPSPSSLPSPVPSARPSPQPTAQPTVQPSAQPTAQPTPQPTPQPSAQPSPQPTFQPTVQPTAQPTTKPTPRPSSKPTPRPSALPSTQPTGRPSGRPTSHPSRSPSSAPSALPTLQPVSHPSSSPSSQPAGQPTLAPQRVLKGGSVDTSSLASVLSTTQGRSYLYYALAGLVVACCVAAAVYRYWCSKSAGGARTAYEQWVDYEEAKKRGDKPAEVAPVAPRPLTIAIKKLYGGANKAQPQGQGGVEMSDVIPAPYPTLNFLHADAPSASASPGAEAGGRAVRTISDLQMNQLYRRSQLDRLERHSEEGPSSQPPSLPQAKRPTTLPAHYNPMAALGGSAGRLPLHGQGQGGHAAGGGIDHSPSPSPPPAAGAGAAGHTSVGLQAASVTNPLQAKLGGQRGAKPQPPPPPPPPPAARPSRLASFVSSLFGRGSRPSSSAATAAAAASGAGPGPGPGPGLAEDDEAAREQQALGQWQQQQQQQERGALDAGAGAGGYGASSDQPSRHSSPSARNARALSSAPSIPEEDEDEEDEEEDAPPPPSWSPEDESPASPPRRL